MHVDPTEIIHLFKQQPFSPLRVHLSDGSHYDISHPDQAIVTRRSLHVGVLPREDEGLYLRVHTVAMVHITRLEVLRSEAS